MVSWYVSMQTQTVSRQRGKMGEAQTLDAIGLCAPAVPQCRRRLDSIGWLVSGQDAGSWRAHGRSTPATLQTRTHIKMQKCGNRKIKRVCVPFPPWSQFGCIRLWLSNIYNLRCIICAWNSTFPNLGFGQSTYFWFLCNQPYEHEHYFNV